MWNFRLVYLIVCLSIPKLNRQLPSSKPATIERLNAGVSFVGLLKRDWCHTIWVPLEHKHSHIPALSSDSNILNSQSCWTLTHSTEDIQLTSKRMTFLTLPNFSHSVRRSSRYSFNTSGSSYRSQHKDQRDYRHRLDVREWVCTWVCAPQSHWDGTCS